MEIRNNPASICTLQHAPGTTYRLTTVINYNALSVMGAPVIKHTKRFIYSKK